jgi:hypothetical protein
MCAARTRYEIGALGRFVLVVCRLSTAQPKAEKDPGSLSVLHPFHFALVHLGTWHDALNDATATNAMTLEYQIHGRYICIIPKNKR